MNGKYLLIDSDASIHKDQRLFLRGGSICWTRRLPALSLMFLKLLKRH